MSFEPRYTPEQKQTVIDLVLNDEFKVKEAVAQVAQGVNDVPPFQMPLSTAHNLVWQERKRRQAAELEASVMADPWGSLVRCRDKLAVIVEESVQQKLEQPETITPSDVRNWLRTMQSLTGLTRSLYGTPEPPDEENGRSSVIDNLTRQLMAAAEHAQPDTEDDETAGFSHERDWMDSRTHA